MNSMLAAMYEIVIRPSFIAVYVRILGYAGIVRVFTHLTLSEVIFVLIET